MSEVSKFEWNNILSYVTNQFLKVTGGNNREHQPLSKESF